jgi:ribosome-associated translation inhibitor RaiA
MSAPPSSAQPQAAVPIIIDGRNIDVTPALEEYVNKRIGGTLNKLSSNGAVRECDVILSVSKNPKVSD